MNSAISLGGGGGGAGEILHSSARLLNLYLDFVFKCLQVTTIQKFQLKIEFYKNSWPLV